MPDLHAPPSLSVDHVRQPAFDRTDLLWVTILVAAIAAVRVINLAGYPQFFEDEATYISQAWAVTNLGELSHYTYWYDHPPFGWLQMALWSVLTLGWTRSPNAVMLGREIALVAGLATVVLLYVFGRRLNMRRAAIVVAVLLFGLSPLSVFFHRMALLDNMLMPWLLGAFVLALSPRRQLVAYAASGACLALACLTKLTSGLFLPAIAYLVWRRTPPSIRRYAIGLFGSAFLGLSLLWPAMAMLKGEFLPEPGVGFPGNERVSLISTQLWVMFGRGDPGSVFDPASPAHFMVRELWLSHDAWLLGLGVVAAAVTLFSTKFRLLGIVYLGLTVIVLFAGTMSFPYIVTFVPFAALAIGGTIDMSLDWFNALQSRYQRPILYPVAIAVWSPLLLLAVVWAGPLHYSMTHDANGPYRQSNAWLAANVPADATLLVDNVTWIDAILAGRPRERVIWMYKLEHDPAVIEVFGDWTAFDFAVSTAFARGEQSRLPQMNNALINSTPLRQFDGPNNGYEYVQIRRILPPSAPTPKSINE